MDVCVNVMRGLRDIVSVQAQHNGHRNKDKVITVINRSAHQGISQALAYINGGYQDIIDLDLKSFFDVVNHDLLMGILYRKVKDERLLRLIRKYLKTGLLIGGLEQQREEGTPQEDGASRKYPVDIFSGRARFVGWH